MTSARVNPSLKTGVIPAIKFDDVGELRFMAATAGYVMCRRPGCYPTIRTMTEWRALSDRPWSAEP